MILSNRNEDTINDLCYLLNIKKEVSRRVLMENIVPKIIDILELDKDSSYKDIFYSIYERKLEENNINRIELCKPRYHNCGEASAVGSCG